MLRLLDLFLLLQEPLFQRLDPTELIFIANDIIFIGKATAQRVRRRIAGTCGVPEAHIMVTATHTHSGPVTVDYVSNEMDPVVPKADADYLAFLEDRIVEAALAARQAAESAEIGLALAHAGGVGTNRRDPNGPADPEMPVLMARSAQDRRPLACMLIYSMHPTILHEDSTLISGDFPGMTRCFLQQSVLGESCPVLYHTGPAGNQSPRHVTRANTFAEAERLGGLLGEAAAKIIPGIPFQANLRLACRTALVDLPRRSFPSVEWAKANLETARKRLEQLRREGVSRQDVRTAECDCFGAEETLSLARANAEGRIEAACRACMPAEVQAFMIGPWSFVAWPGEVFVEYALELKSSCRNVFVISLANGELQGYIVTEEAAAEGGYEASNALFAPEAGRRLVEATRELLA